MTVTDATKINMAVPEYDLDKIIGILTGTFTAIAPTAVEGQHTTTLSSNTGFNEACYWQGIYSIDSGVSWNDLGVDVPDSSQLNGLNVNAYSDPSLLVLSAVNNYDSVAGTGHTYTVNYKVALVSSNNQTAISPIPTNEILYYNSAQNYPKIFMQGTVDYNTTSGNSFTATITHNLGYIPKVKAFLNGFAATNRISPFGNIAPTIKIDETSVTFFTDSVLTSTQDSNIEYRIYLDA